MDRKSLGGSARRIVLLTALAVPAWLLMVFLLTLLPAPFSLPTMFTGLVLFGIGRACEHVESTVWQQRLKIVVIVGGIMMFAGVGGAVVHNVLK